MKKEYFLPGGDFASAVFNDILKVQKINTARLTMCDLNYEGSLAVDLAILREANIVPYEKILVVNRSNGERLETYAIPAKAGSKVFCLNGPAALKGKVGDVVTIMAFSLCDPAEAYQISPYIVVMDENNNIVLKKGRFSEEDLLP